MASGDAAEASAPGWWARAQGRLKRPPRFEIDARRWIVADVETGGFDPKRDRLLAIAAVALHFERTGGAPRIALGDSFEVTLRQAEAAAQPDRENILLHGIGIGAQRGGMPAPDALAAWLRFIGRSPLVAFHSAFDQTAIGSACRAALGSEPRNPWLDIEPLLASAHDDPKRRALDDWLERLGIVCVARHQAASDALATAQLLLRAWPLLARRLPDLRFASLHRAATIARHLPGRG